MVYQTRFESQSLALAKSIEGFHRRFGITPPHEDDLMPCLRDRVGLLVEELGEHVAALNRGDRDKAIVELVDVVYVALGSLYMLNLDGEDAVDAVVNKNDAKTFDTHQFHPESGKLVRQSES